MVAVGNNTFVFADKIVVITGYESSKMKKEVLALRESEHSGKLIDASKHKAVKAVVILENGTHILSTLSPETLVRRFEGLMGGYNEQE